MSRGQKERSTKCPAARGMADIRGFLPRNTQQSHSAGKNLLFVLQNAAVAGEAGNKKKGGEEKGKERGRGKGSRAAAEQVGPGPSVAQRCFLGYP